MYIYIDVCKICIIFILTYFHEICTLFHDILILHEIFEKDRTSDSGFPKCDTIGRSRARP